MILTIRQEELVERAKGWVSEHGIPLPVDLYFELVDEGLLVEAEAINEGQE